MVHMGVSQNWGVPFWGVPIIIIITRIRMIVYWGLYWGPRILGNYHISRVS